MRNGTEVELGTDPAPIRVLQVLDKFSIDGKSIHGVARLLSWWVNSVDPRLVDFKVLGLSPPSRAGDYLEQKGADVFYSSRGRFNPLTILDIVRIARKCEIDILHLHGYKASVFGRIAAGLLRKPVILHEHAVFPEIPLYQKLADRFFAPLTDRTIVNCEAVAVFCAEHRAIRYSEIDVIFNGIPIEDFRDVPDAEVQRVARELGLEPGVPIVGTVARLDEQKGISFFLKAIPAIKASVPGVKALVVGDGVLRQSLEDEAEQLGISEDVIFTGERRDVAPLYQLMQVKVISSVYEGTTLTAFEAMAAGTPLVATTVDGVKEILRNDVTALLIPPRDPIAISEAVTSLLRDPGRARGLSDRARKAVMEYDVAASMRRIEEVYRHVLERRRQESASNTAEKA